MKTHQLIPRAAVMVLSFVLVNSTFGQGTLTPPGVPAATMKSLDQVYAELDPRIPITNTASLVAITQPGSYYLTGNLTVTTGDGIDINTNGVTLDLNGFIIASTAASATGTGILLAGGFKNIKIINGLIQGGVTNNGSGVYSGGGFANGIYYSLNQPVNVMVSGITVSGCQSYGIELFVNSTEVEACTVRTVGGEGIVAYTIKNCFALDCGSFAIDGDNVSDSEGQSSGGYGIYANDAVQNCYGQGSGSGYGINADTAQNCYGTSGPGTGLYAVKTASGCYGSSNGGTGLSAFIANSCSGTSLSVTHNLNSY